MVERVPRGPKKKTQKGRNKEVKLLIWGCVVNRSEKGKRNWFSLKLIFISIKAGECLDRAYYLREIKKREFLMPRSYMYAGTENV